MIILAAIDEEGGIGREGVVPWYIPADLAYFKRLTQNGTLIMGRKTYETLGGGLKGRDHIIMTRTATCSKQHTFCCSIEEVLELCGMIDKGIYIIGGSEIYKLFLDRGLVSEMIITRVSSVYGCDRFFPAFDCSRFREDYAYAKYFPESKENKIPFTIERYCIR